MQAASTIISKQENDNPNSSTGQYDKEAPLPQPVTILKVKTKTSTHNLRTAQTLELAHISIKKEESKHQKETSSLNTSI